MWQNSKTQNETKLKNSKWDETQNSKCKKKNSKIPNLTTQKTQMGQNLKTKNFKKLKNWKHEKK